MKLNSYDCIILIFDVTNYESFLTIKEFWYPKTKEFPNINLIYLIGNKIDLERKVPREEAMNFANENNLRYFETSYLTGEGIQEFFNDLVNEITKI